MPWCEHGSAKGAFLLSVFIMCHSFSDLLQDAGRSQDEAVVKKMMFELQELDAADEADHVYTCTLTMEPFRDPVVTPDGNSFERTALLDHLKKVRPLAITPWLWFPNWTLCTALVSAQGHVLSHIPVNTCILRAYHWLCLNTMSICRLAVSNL